MKASILAITLAALLCGCAAPRGPNDVSLSVVSDPPGAQIYFTTDNGMKLYGFSPQTVTYTADPQDRKAGYFNTSAVSARWASGATQTVSGIKIVLDGRDKTFTIKRPEGVAGLDVDYRFAADLAARQSQGDEGAGSAALLGIVLGGAAAYQSGRASAPVLLEQPRQPIRCTTNVIGNIANTNCN